MQVKPLQSDLLAVLGQISLLGLNTVQSGTVGVFLKILKGNENKLTGSMVLYKSCKVSEQVK